MSLGLIVFTEEAYSEGWQEEEAGPEVHAGLHPPCRGWHHGRCQLCTYTGRSFVQCKQLLYQSPIHAGTLEKGLPGVVQFLGCRREIR